MKLVEGAVKLSDEPRSVEHQRATDGESHQRQQPPHDHEAEHHVEQHLLVVPPGAVGALTQIGGRRALDERAQVGAHPLELVVDGLPIPSPTIHRHMVSLSQPVNSSAALVVESGDVVSPAGRSGEGGPGGLIARTMGHAQLL